MRLCNSFLTLGFPYFDGLNVSKIDPKSPAVHYASEEFHLCREEGAFVWIQFKYKFVKSDEKLFQCAQLLAKCLWGGGNVGRYVRTRRDSG